MPYYQASLTAIPSLCGLHFLVSVLQVHPFDRPCPNLGKEMVYYLLVSYDLGLYQDISDRDHLARNIKLRDLSIASLILEKVLSMHQHRTDSPTPRSFRVPEFL